jgi:hypothetical protein
VPKKNSLRSFYQSSARREEEGTQYFSVRNCSLSSVDFHRLARKFEKQARQSWDGSLFTFLFFTFISVMRVDWDCASPGKQVVIRERNQAWSVALLGTSTSKVRWLFSSNAIHQGVAFCIMHCSQLSIHAHFLLSWKYIFPYYRYFRYMVNFLRSKFI